MTNKELQIKLGNATEKFICKTFRRHGYWVYNIPKKTNGQPCDIVAIRGAKSWLVDGKHVEEGKVSFAFDRVEDNQVSSLTYARDFAQIERVGFAVFFERTKTLYWLHFTRYQELVAQGVKSVNLADLEPFEGILINEEHN